MQENNEVVVNYLKEKGFLKIRDLGDQIKINVEFLDTLDLIMLTNIPISLKILIKRSGTGLVVILKN